MAIATGRRGDRRWRRIITMAVAMVILQYVNEWAENLPVYLFCRTTTHCTFQDEAP